MIANKNPAAILEPLHEKLASLTVLPVDGHESHRAEAFSQFADDISEAPDLESALKQLDVGKNATILIAGSLYLAGEVLRANEQVPD